MIPTTGEPSARLRAWVDSWGVVVEQIIETTSSIVALGHRNYQPVAVKIARTASDEWHAGRALSAFDGRGVVRAIEHGHGAVLIERLVPGTPLTGIANDDQATAIIAGVIQRMSPIAPPAGARTVESFAHSFERYLKGTARCIPERLVRQARDTYLMLCVSQGPTRLLHGDLHHDNVLLDQRRGWLAIDPKGVVGEVEYEVGAALRNPVEHPELFASAATIERRVHRFSQTLGLDEKRVLMWAFSQAVLAALWELEDEGGLTSGIGWVALAGSIGSILGQDFDV